MTKDPDTVLFGIETGQDEAFAALDRITARLEAYEAEHEAWERKAWIEHHRAHETAERIRREQDDG